MDTFKKLSGIMKDIKTNEIQLLEMKTTIIKMKNSLN